MMFQTKGPGGSFQKLQLPSLEGFMVDLEACLGSLSCCRIPLLLIINVFFSSTPMWWICRYLVESSSSLYLRHVSLLQWNPKAWWTHPQASLLARCPFHHMLLIVFSKHTIADSGQASSVQNTFFQNTPGFCRYCIRLMLDFMMRRQERFSPKASSTKVSFVWVKLHGGIVHHHSWLIVPAGFLAVKLGFLICNSDQFTSKRSTQQPYLHFTLEKKNALPYSCRLCQQLSSTESALCLHKV